MATQSPIECEGTYRLPQAQLDRFLLKLSIQFPPPEEEDRILRLYQGRATLGPPLEVLGPAPDGGAQRPRRAEPGAAAPGAAGDGRRRRQGGGVRLRR